MTRPAPYPADTRAKGWRFELDYEQIEQSSTWGEAMALAMEGLPLGRPLLLAMWYAAWKQAPCGSLPSNDRELAGTIGIPPSIFAEYRDVLLRGWWLADDGRLYHPTLTSRVVEMMSRRRSDADRQAAKRAREAAESAASRADVTRDKPVTPTEVRSESSTDNRPPKKISKPTASHPPAGGAGGFAEFWTAWPKNERKQDKAKCAAHWKLHDLDAVQDAILADVRVKRGTQKWTEGFIEAPLVYLRGRRWEDGVTPNEGPTAAAVDWRATGPSIVAKGIEVGCGEWSEALWVAGKAPDFPTYRARVDRRVAELEQGLLQAA